MKNEGLDFACEDRSYCFCLLVSLSRVLHGTARQKYLYFCSCVCVCVCVFPSGTKILYLKATSQLEILMLLLGGCWLLQQVHLQCLMANPSMSDPHPVTLSGSVIGISHLNKRVFGFFLKIILDRRIFIKQCD